MTGSGTRKTKQRHLLGALDVMPNWLLGGKNTSLRCVVSSVGSVTRQRLFSITAICRLSRVMLACWCRVGALEKRFLPRLRSAWFFAPTVTRLWFGTSGMVKTREKTVRADLTPEEQEAKRAYDRDWYHRNQEKSKAKVRARRAQYVARWKEYKSKLSCQKCGFSHPGALHFHHRDPSQKDDNLGSMMGRGVAWETLLKEIEKCDVLCANCHAILTWAQEQEQNPVQKQDCPPFALDMNTSA